MVGADADPAKVVGGIINTVGDGFSTVGVDKIIGFHLDGFAFGRPFLAAVEVISHQFLLFGVHGNDRAGPRLKGLHSGGDVPKLGVAVRMLFALKAFSVPLEAVVFGFEKTAHGVGRDGMALTGEFTGERSGALAGPAQRTHGIPAGAGFHEFVESRRQSRIFGGEGLASASGTSLPAGAGSPGWRPGQLIHPFLNRFGHQPRGAGHGADPAITHLKRFRSRPQPPAFLVEALFDAGVAVADRLMGMCLHPTVSSGIQQKLSNLFCGGSLPAS